MCVCACVCVRVCVCVCVCACVCGVYRETHRAIDRASCVVRRVSYRASLTQPPFHSPVWRLRASVRAALPVSGLDWRGVA